MHHHRISDQEKAEIYTRDIFALGLCFGIAGSWVRLNFRYNLDTVSCQINRLDTYFPTITPLFGSTRDSNE